jgi:hypothetical protein
MKKNNKVKNIRRRLKFNVGLFSYILTFAFFGCIPEIMGATIEGVDVIFIATASYCAWMIFYAVLSENKSYLEFIEEITKMYCNVFYIEYKE